MKCDDIHSFRAWACGNFVDNLNRGSFAEWLVGCALGVIEENAPRKEWDLCDFHYNGRKIEVKCSGLGQAWDSGKPSTPRFDIEQRKEEWYAATNKRKKLDPPRRTADIDVFCLHEAIPATNENVADRSRWKFWVVSTNTINEKLGGQKSLGCRTLNQLAKFIPWENIKTAVDRCP